MDDARSLSVSTGGRKDELGGLPTTSVRRIGNEDVEYEDTKQFDVVVLGGNCVSLLRGMCSGLTECCLGF